MQPQFGQKWPQLQRKNVEIATPLESSPSQVSMNKHSEKKNIFCLSKFFLQMRSPVTGGTLRKLFRLSVV